MFPDTWAPGLLSWAVLAAFSYLAGSFPTAYAWGRWVRGEDIRALGNGNIGAGNAGHVWGLKVGLLVGFVDCAKGMTVVWLAQLALDGQSAPMVAGIAAILGDAWPVYLGRSGGRGGAVAGGVLLALLPWVAVPAGLLALVVLGFTRNTTYALASYYLLIVALAWRWDRYSDSWAVFALVVPVLVGAIHFLSLRRRLRTG